MMTVPQKGKSNHRQAAIDEKTANKFQLFFLFYFFCSPTYACAVLSMVQVAVLESLRKGCIC